jgi:hypothetical protein
MANALRCPTLTTTRRLPRVTAVGALPNSRDTAQYPDSKEKPPHCPSEANFDRAKMTRTGLWQGMP